MSRKRNKSQQNPAEWNSAAFKALVCVGSLRAYWMSVCTRLYKTSKLLRQRVDENTNAVVYNVEA